MKTANSAAFYGYSGDYGTLYFTADDYLSPSEMSALFDDSYFEDCDSTRWFIKADAALSSYSSEDACDFTDIVTSSCVVTSNLVNCNYYSWYINPSTYQFFSLYSGGKSECYIPVETTEIAEGATAKYFTITFYTDTKYTSKTIWIAMP